VVKAAALSVRVTVAPPLGAAFDSVTVQVVLAFENNVAAAHCRALTVTGATSEMVADCDTPLSVAVIVAVWSVENEPALAVKFALVPLAGIATEAGVVNAAALSARVTVTPPAGAACDNVTVQVVLALGAKLAAAHCSAEIEFVAGTNDSDSEAEEVLSVAVIVAVSLKLKASVTAEKFATVAPPATETKDGTVKSVELELRATTVPPLGAACDSVSVHRVVVCGANDPVGHCRLTVVLTPASRNSNAV
jgi:hypothetical protein